MWKIDKKWEGNPSERTVYSRSGPVAAPGYVSGNAAEIEVHKNYNGSGKQAFGGVHEWPAITMRIGLPADATAAEIALLVENLKLAYDGFCLNPQRDESLKTLDSDANGDIVHAKK